MAALLRPGNAGSNTAAGHITATRLALAQLPKRHQRGRSTLIRPDSAGGTHEFVTTPRSTAWRYSYSLTMHRRARTPRPATAKRSPPTRPPKPGRATGCRRRYGPRDQAPRDAARPKARSAMTRPALERLRARTAREAPPDRAGARALRRLADEWAGRYGPSARIGVRRDGRQAVPARRPRQVFSGWFGMLCSHLDRHTHVLFKGFVCRTEGPVVGYRH